MDARPIVAACLRAIGRSLAMASCMWVEHLPVSDKPVRERIWVTPPPGHPERLRPDIPLSAVERHLARSLLRREDIA